jgi:hypothetical protein
MADGSPGLRARISSRGVVGLAVLALTAACGQPLAVGRPAAPGTNASATLAEARAALPAARDVPRDYQLVADTYTAAPGATRTGDVTTTVATRDAVTLPDCQGSIAPPAANVEGVARGYQLVRRGTRTVATGPRDDELSITVYVRTDRTLMSRVRQAVAAGCGPRAGDFRMRSDGAGDALSVLGRDQRRRGLAEYVVSFGEIIVIVRDITGGARHGRDAAAAEAEATKYLDLVCGRLLRRRFAITGS